METNITVIDFDIELAKQIVSGQKKGCFVTRGGYPAAINALDCANCEIPGHHISYTVIKDDRSFVFNCYGNGLISADGDKNLYDLMIQIDEAVEARTVYKDCDILTLPEDMLVYFYRANPDNDPLKWHCCTILGGNGIDFSQKGFYEESTETFKSAKRRTVRLATEDERKELLSKFSKEFDAIAEVNRRFKNIQAQQEPQQANSVQACGKPEPQPANELKNGDVVYYKDKFREIIYIYCANDDNNLFKCHASVYFEPNTPVFGPNVNIVPNDSSVIRRANKQEINFLAKQIIANKSICHELASKGLFAVKVSVGDSHTRLTFHEYYTILRDSHNGQQTT